jgi:hypothetical protein
MARKKFLDVFLQAVRILKVSTSFNDEGIVPSKPAAENSPCLGRCTNFLPKKNEGNSIENAVSF